MKSKLLKRLLTYLSVFIFWVSVWWTVSVLVNNSSPATLIPTPLETARALIDLFAMPSFYTAVLTSFLRVIIGLTLGIIIGTALAFMCHRIAFLRHLLAPIISIIKAMPVATFILILWITLRGSTLTICIGVIMVMPIIFQNVLTGIDSMSVELIEVTRIFNFTFAKKLCALIIPSLLPHLSSAIITSVGLAFKSQIAAEIIAYTENTIGQYIYDANFGLKTDTVFAWATVIVLFSIGLECLCKYLLRRVKNEA